MAWEKFANMTFLIQIFRGNILPKRGGFRKNSKLRSSVRITVIVSSAG